jgi:hypothetical protein
VLKQICREVYFTRLPVGHLHEDIDAFFGIIWSCFSLSPCLTLEEYITTITRKFADSSLKPVIKDVIVVPDYERFFDADRCIDKYLSKLHKKQYTQHQWRFEAKNKSVGYMLCAKTTFKAYSSDAVVEIYKKHPGECFSTIGHYTGLEVTKLLCPWYPAANEDGSLEGREGIEGFHILEAIPSRLQIASIRFHFLPTLKRRLKRLCVR